MLAKGSRLLQVAADEQGRFFARLDGDVMRRAFGTGDIGVVARGRLATPFSEPGWSEVVALRAPLPESMSQWLYAALLALMAAALVWRRVRDRLRERALARELEDIAAGLPTTSVRRAGTGGIAMRDLRGTVLHGENGRPTPATVELRDGEGALVRGFDAPDGRVFVEGMDDGDWVLRVQVDEHEPLELGVRIPHDGIYDGCELLPRSHRAVVRGAYAGVIRRASERAMDWRRETPRMAEPRWLSASRRGHALIRDAVARVERAVYGRPTSAAHVRAAREAIEAAEERR